MMTPHEYAFLTANWESVKGGSYNKVYEFCKALGWLKSLDEEGKPILTPKGMDAIRAYQANENYLRVDVI